MKVSVFFASLMILLGSSSTLMSQDIGVLSITEPNSSCTLSSSEDVTIVIKNFTSTTFTPTFNVAYTVNGGAPVIESISTNVPASSTINYTFSTNVNLSSNGSYTFKCYTAYVLDLTKSNDTISNYVVNNYYSSVGGSVNSSAGGCSGSNSGILTLSGHTGSVLYWEFSTNGGSTWTPIINTTTTQNYLNLTLTTLYRAVVQSGTCSSANSSSATITISPTTVSGNVSGGTSVCSGSNSGSLTLSGHTGSILNWEYSTDGGSTWTTIANTTTSQNYLNLTSTTIYRAVVQSGICSAANSSSGTVSVSSPSVGGSVSGIATVCSSSNSGTVSLSGHTGSVMNWEYSTDGGSTWIPIINNTATQNYLNITTTTVYHAIVQNGACSSINSSSVTITVSPPTLGGTVLSSASTCSGSNSGTLTLSGHGGSILNWEFSIDGGSTWTPIVNTTTSQNYLNLTATTIYRAVVQSGVCSAANSGPATITVSPPSIGGTTTGDATVCSGINSGSILLSGYTGSVISWEFSTDGGSTWTTISNTTNTLSYLNLINTTLYHAIVKSGECLTVYSSSTTITVNPSPTGGLVSGSDTLCSGSNSGILSLSGHTGSVMNWEFSIDGGSTWNTIINTTTTQNYLNLTTTTIYRSVVQLSGCNANSATATITIIPTTIGGSISGEAFACTGINSGTLTLSGQLGTILNWEYSTDGGSTWTSIVNTTTTQNYLNLTTTTIYHAIVQSGFCSPATSTSATIFISPATVGGSISSFATVCSGLNSGTLTLSGHLGAVLSWAYSIDGGSTWTSIANTTTNQNYLNLTTTTRYRAIIQSGTCPAANSSSVTITVTAAPNGGTLSGISTVCSSSNSGSVSLSGHTGSVINWEYSIDGGTIWNTISNTTTTQNYLNLITTTMYQAVVQLGGCTTKSSIVTISVSPPTVGGAISSSTNVCSGSNGGTLTLSGHSGGIVRWEYSTDGGGTWINIANTTINQTYLNLTLTTEYRAIVQSGVCSSEIATSVTITVDPQTIGGILNGNATVCYGSNNGTLTLSGHTGSVINWEFSIDAGASWTTIVNSTVSNNYINLISPTWYKANVKNGACPAASSTIAILSIALLPIADAGNDTTISLGNSIQLNGTGGVTYLWTPSTGLNNPTIPNPLASPSVSTTYELTVTNENGCVDNAFIFITVLFDYRFKATNLITPNGDLKNDVWYIDNITEYPMCEVSIYNIYDKKLFVASPYNNDWDGTYLGNQLPDGTYFYIIKCPDSENETKGYVTILRNK